MNRPPVFGQHGNRGRERPCGRPPRRFQHAELTHWAPASNTNVEARFWIGMQDAGRGQPSSPDVARRYPDAVAAFQRRVGIVGGRTGRRGRSLLRLDPVPQRRGLDLQQLPHVPTRGQLGLAVITQPVGVEADRAGTGLLVELAGSRHGSSLTVKSGASPGPSRRFTTASAVSRSGRSRRITSPRRMPLTASRPDRPDPVILRRPGTPPAALIRGLPALLLIHPVVGLTQECSEIAARRVGRP